MFLDQQSWLLVFFIYLFASVGFDQSYTLLTRKNSNKSTGTILLQLLAGFLSLLFIPLFRWQLPASINAWLILFLASIFYALNDRLQMTARSHLELSEFIPISQLSKVFLFIFGLVIFKEPFSWSKLFGMILVLLGNIVMHFHQGKLRFNLYTLLGSLAMLSLAIAISIDVSISRQFNMALYAFLTMLIPALIITIAERPSLASFVHEWHLARQWYFLTAFFWIITYTTSVLAYRLGRNISLQISLRGLLPILDFIFAYFLLKEKRHLPRKLFALSLLTLGVLLGTH